MSEYSKRLGFFLEILKLVEYIPIDSSIPSNGRFADNLTMDSEFYFESLQRKGSFRDIIRLITRELAKEKEDDTTFKSILFPEQRVNKLREIGCSYPVEYLFFDFCLAVLDGDYLDAGLYLAHSFHILGLSKLFNLVLSVIVNEQLAYDKDARELIALLARAIEPPNAEAYIDTYGNSFRKRYDVYKGAKKESKIML
jgi:hypothetical protein